MVVCGNLHLSHAIIAFHSRGVVLEGKTNILNSSYHKLAEKSATFEMNILAVTHAKYETNTSEIKINKNCDNDESRKT